MGSLAVLSGEYAFKLEYRESCRALSLCLRVESVGSFLSVIQAAKRICSCGFYLELTSKVRDAIFHFATTVLGIRGVGRWSSGSAAGGFRDGDTRAILR